MRSKLVTNQQDLAEDWSGQTTTWKAGLPSKCEPSIGVAKGKGCSGHGLLKNWWLLRLGCNDR
jgi:hypothetical protein